MSMGSGAAPPVPSIYELIRRADFLRRQFWDSCEVVRTLEAIPGPHEGRAKAIESEKLRGADLAFRYRAATGRLIAAIGHGVLDVSS